MSAQLGQLGDVEAIFNASTIAAQITKLPEWRDTLAILDRQLRELEKRNAPKKRIADARQQWDIAANRLRAVDRQASAAYTTAAGLGLVSLPAPRTAGLEPPGLNGVTLYGVLKIGLGTALIIAGFITGAAWATAVGALIAAISVVTDLVKAIAEIVNGTPDSGGNLVGGIGGLGTTALVLGAAALGWAIFNARGRR